MKGVILLAVVTVTFANIVPHSVSNSYGFNSRLSNPLDEEISQGDISSRIAGGYYAELGQFPYLAGVITTYNNLSDLGVCGGSLITASRVVEAAHCWLDGKRSPRASEVVLGSISLFHGGIRMTTSTVVVHPQWDPITFNNDIALIYLPNPVEFSSSISPIALPSGDQLNEDFLCETAVASGFGNISDDPRDSIIPITQTLKYAELVIIPNCVCETFYDNIQASVVCVSGSDATSICKGDSGGPLVVLRNNQPILIGITSYLNILGCTLGSPTGFTRVTHIIDFINKHI